MNELNPVYIQAQVAINIKPLWLDFPKHHMKASLSLLSVKELSQAACKSLSLCQVNRKYKDFQIDTILNHFHTLSTQYELLNNTHKLFWGLGELHVFNFFSEALTETGTKCLMIPPCVI
jgi:hypothetical protein